MSVHNGDRTDVVNVVRYFPDRAEFMRWEQPEGYPDCGGWARIR